MGITWISWGVAPGYINIAPLGPSRGVAPGYINLAPLGLSWGGAPGYINIAPLGLTQWSPNFSLALESKL
ncbi:MAG: hypothetical protein DRR08_12700 [Candidatus Parabeggiatoa sp. nov. 2]|nr:MAG: hypothetical protein B6247_08780 [Beggiatoa sp. 4572_84]RKZ59901.1 MAG: hypothetical protein DRR08_12700 [Gammaproteobacteria bacterium]